MDFNIFAIYACGSVVFLIVLICGELLFAARYARRKRFALRFVCGNAAVIIFSILLTLLYYYIEVTFNSSLISAIRVVVTYIILFVLAIAAMYFSYKESLWRCLTAGALGYICQHIAYNIYSIIDVSANFEYGVIVSLGMGGYALAVLLQLAIAAMVPFSVWLIFGRKINSFSADGIARTNAMFIIISSLAIVIILGSLGAVFGADNLGVNIVFKCLLIACCILMLILYVNIFEVKEARAERDIVLKLNENEHAHFLKLKQDMELISVKCHDIKHFIAAAGIVLYFFMNNAETTQFNADLLIQGIIAAAGAVACTVLAAIKRVRPGKLAAIIMVPAVLIVAVYGIVWGASTAAANGLTSAQTSIWSVPDKYEATDCPEQGSVEELTYTTKAYATDGRTVEKRALVYLPYGYSAERVRHTLSSPRHGRRRRVLAENQSLQQGYARQPHILRRNRADDSRHAHLVRGGRLQGQP